MPQRIKFFSSLLLLLFIIPLTLTQCRKETGYKNLKPTFMWGKNQFHIDTSTGTKHLWSGFTIEDDLFRAIKKISKFILWREKQEELEFTLEYLLKGASIDLFVNGIKVKRLKPKFKIQPVKIKAPFIHGFNFIEFRKRGKGRLRIKSISINDNTNKTGETGLLSEGNTLTMFQPAGSGSISIDGKGSLHVREVEFVNGQKITRKKELKKGPKTLSLSFQSPGFLQLSAKTGTFNITDYSYKKAAKEEPSPATVPNKRPHIYIFLIDGCQASHLGIYGYYRDTSPNIDQLAKDSVVFQNAYANATFTRSSVATIFSGYLPQRHKLRILTNRLPNGLFMMPEFLQRKGYKTAILTEAGNISPVFGFAQGVDHYYKAFWKWDDPRYLENNILNNFTKWLETTGPLFTYIHFRAPHFPIIPPPPFLDMYKKKKTGVVEGRILTNLTELEKSGHIFTPEEIQDVTDDYDSCIRYVDAEVGKLIDRLKKKDLYHSSLIIFTADHGEGLYEHKAWGHGHNVCEETSHVPLVVKFPKSKNLTGIVERVVQLADIFPTVAFLLGGERYFDGESLLTSIKKRKIDDRFAFSTTFKIPPSIGMRWRSWYYILHLRRNNKEELYNLDTDRLRDVAASRENRDILTFFRAKFLNWYIEFDNLGRTGQSIDLKKLPTEELENLRSLGYIN
jgi:arylsulfatase A-like enzyme